MPNLINYALSGFLMLGSFGISIAQEIQSPKNLRVELLRNPSSVYQGGILSKVTLQEAIKSPTLVQFCEVNSRYPSFSWNVDAYHGGRQTAYQIILSKRKNLISKNKIVLWNTGKIRSGENIGINYSASTALEPAILYYWKVRIWYSDGTVSPYAQVQVFYTGKEMKDYDLPSFVLCKQTQTPGSVKLFGKHDILYDFGKDAFGQVDLTVCSDSIGDTLLVHVGEKLASDGHIDRNPPGTIRYQLIKLPVRQGSQVYRAQFIPNKLNTGSKAVKMPDYIGEVLPFRYVEIINASNTCKIEKVSRNMVTNVFDDDASTFTSSDTDLNRIWDLCKYSVKATSFTGFYVDGDRERIPYEADALINQLSHYSCDAEYLMAKRSLRYLIDHPTWPTEWSLQNIFIAWNDYLYSGDLRLGRELYPDLKHKLLTALAREDGLISTRTAKQTPEFLKTIHYKSFNSNPILKDIVDWPQQNVLSAGETDGFVFTDYNSVVNAYHYEALLLMHRLALALNEKTDAGFYDRQAAKVKQAFIKTFLDPKTGLILDGEGAAHSSLHANMFALAFGLIPEKDIPKVLVFIHSRGMACSVYGAQFLLDGISSGNDPDYALKLLTARNKRSWFNMIDEGATITMEAWGQEYKPNQDWNHAWGTAPANYIVRNLMGIQPLTAGFRKIKIKPQPGKLERASLKYLTIRGYIRVDFENGQKYFKMNVNLPGNTTGTVSLPFFSSEATVFMDGHPATSVFKDNCWTIENVGPGKHMFEVRL